MATVTGLRNHWREFDFAAELPVRFRHLAWLSTGMFGLAALPRIRKFLWLSAGMFSAATFAMAMVGVVLYGRMDAVATSFLAGTVSAALFGLASIFRFGPDAA